MDVPASGRLAHGQQAESSGGVAVVPCEFMPTEALVRACCMFEQDDRLFHDMGGRRCTVAGGVRLRLLRIRGTRTHSGSRRLPALCGASVRHHHFSGFAHAGAPVVV